MPGRSFAGWTFWWLVVAAFATRLSAQSWVEEGDAMSFPERAAQVTRGPRALATITGATGPADPRDAYCIRIDESFVFLATTDPATHASANADFDTRLFLFDEYGRPVLANDDTSTGGTLSTLDGTATDGSGFILEQRGKYVLVVAGAGDEPRDLAGSGLFDFTAGSDLIHARASSAGTFADWVGGAPATGSYTLALEGVEFCQEKLSAVFTRSDAATPGALNRYCIGDGGGGFSACRNVPDVSHASVGAALGYVDPNAHLDLIVANTADQPNRTCTGGDDGIVLCTNVSTPGRSSQNIALHHVDGDSHLDAVVANLGFNKVCYGDGGGLFSSCVEIAEVIPYTLSADVALGYVDEDAAVDAVFATLGEPNRLCLGDGLGNFQTCTSINAVAADTEGVALGRVNDDAYLDIVFANPTRPDGVCLGLGGGLFDCGPIDPGDDARSLDVALGCVDGDLHLDAVFARDTSETNVVCLGDGTGAFTCSDVSLEQDRAEAVALGHMNDDPHLDAVFAGDVDEVCLGDGNGAFTCTIAVTGGLGLSTSVVLGPIVDLFLFGDDFESGDLSRWSSSVP